MSKRKNHFHGSDLEKIEQLYGIKKENIIRFGANVNPLGISPVLSDTLRAHPDCITLYPDREYSSLRSSLSAYCNVDATYMIPGNGSTELIALIIQALSPQKAMILGPSYSEYERELLQISSSFQYFPLREEDDFVLGDTTPLLSALQNTLAGCDNPLFILCNPNNPTSTALTVPQLESILSFCATYSITVMIDETYVEFTKEIDNITAISLLEPYPNLVILRGVSKFFASPGLRLGYAMTSDPSLRSRVLSLQHPWSVNSFAALHAGVMFTDQLYIMRTRNLIHAERERIVERLSRISGIKLYPPEANFILLRILDPTLNASALFETAIAQGLMIRDCSDFPFLGPDYFRFCFMLPKDNDRLLDVIEQVFAKETL